MGLAGGTIGIQQAFSAAPGRAFLPASPFAAGLQRLTLSWRVTAPDGSSYLQHVRVAATDYAGGVALQHGAVIADCQGGDDGGGPGGGDGGGGGDSGGGDSGGNNGGANNPPPPPEPSPPPPPSPNDPTVPTSMDTITVTANYVDGWTISVTYTRSVTPDGHGGYTDGPWNPPINHSSKYTPPKGSGGNGFNGTSDDDPDCPGEGVGDD